MLNHVWDRHKNYLNFRYAYGISSRSSAYTNLQSYKRHVKSNHKWFYEKHVKVSEFNERNNFESNANEEVQGVISDETNDMKLSGSNSSFRNNNVSLILDIIGENDIDELGENNVDFNKVTTCKISNFLKDILQIERRIFSEAIKKSRKKPPCTENGISFQSNKILRSESPFVQVCKNFCGEKALSNCFKAQNFYLEPVDKVVAFDHDKGKSDSTQYVPILFTLKVVLQH